MAWTSSTFSPVRQWCAVTATVSGEDVGTCGESHAGAALFGDLEPFAAATWRFEEAVSTHGGGCGLLFRLRFGAAHEMER